MATQPGIGIKIGLSVHSMIDPRWARDVNEIPVQAKHLGAHIVVENASSSSIRQNQQCEKLLADGVQALIVIALDATAAAKAVEAANQRGIPIIAYERMILNCDLPLYVGFDTSKVGDLLCRYAMQHAPRGNYIILDGDAKDNNAIIIRQQRQKLMQPAIESGTIHPVAECWIEGWSMSQAWQITRETIKKSGTPACILAASDNIAEGACQALNDAGLRGAVPVTGQDGLLGATQRILRGEQAMSIYKPIPLLAKAAVEGALALARQQPLHPTCMLSNGKREVPSLLISNTPVVDKQNVLEVVTGPNGSFTQQQILGSLPQSLWPAEALAAAAH
jgi:D-xylose transport system substrate-binding protein